MASCSTLTRKCIPCSTSARQASCAPPVPGRRSRSLRMPVHAFAKGDVEPGSDAETLRNMVSSQFQYSVKRNARKSTGNPITDLMTKLQLAYRIFFPETKQDLSPKEEVKKRLRMVLVADRCGMSPASLSEMKKTIVKALQDFVDIEGEDGIEVSITSEPGLGTVYSVNIPVRRVKAESRFAEGLEDAVAPDGVTLEWDPTDFNSDPSSRFPMGC